MTQRDATSVASNPACDEHYSYVACKPGQPGAYASCTDDERFWPDFKRREEWAGATVKRVTCNEARRLMGKYLAWLDKEEWIAKHMKINGVGRDTAERKWKSMKRHNLV